MRAALLLLGDTFTELDLYMSVAGLSYAGDFRMGVGENPNKVSNIVMGNIPGFRALYHGGGVLRRIVGTDAEVLRNNPSVCSRARLSGAAVIMNLRVQHEALDMASNIV